MRRSRIRDPGRHGARARWNRATSACIALDEGAGRDPACVEACAAAGHRALVFGDLNDPESPVSRALADAASAELRADFGLDTGVRYRNL